MEANYFTILWWFLSYIDMNQPQVYMCPLILKPLLPPSPSHPSGLSQSTSFEGPASCTKLALVICFIYGNIFQHYSLILFHPCRLPHSPKVHSLHLCLFCSLVYTVVITAFLNSICIYVNILYWCFSF